MSGQQSGSYGKALAVGVLAAGAGALGAWIGGGALGAGLAGGAVAAGGALWAGGGTRTDPALEACIEQINTNDLARAESGLCSTSTNPLHGKMRRVVGDLKSNFKEQVRIASEISDVSQRLRTVAARIQESMEGITANTEMTSRNSERQLQMLLEAQREVREIVSVISDMEREMNETVDFTTHTIDSAQGCLGGTREMLDNMRSIRDMVTAVTERVSGLKSQSNEVNALNAQINSIAEQTNLLALNASIEAARAGEHGRGFAIVATEVSKLSGETNTVSTEIRTVLGGLSAGLQAICDSMEEDMARIDAGYSMMEQTVQEFTGINNALVQSSERLGTMRQSVGRVSRSGERISEEITQVTGFGQDITAQMQEAASQISVQNEQNQNLMKSIETLNSHADRLLQVAADKVMTGKMLRDAREIEAELQGKVLSGSMLGELARKKGIDVIYAGNRNGVIEHCNEACGVGLPLYEIDPSFAPLRERRVEYVSTPIKNRIEDGQLFKFLAILDRQGNLLQIGLSLETLMKF